MKNGGGRKKKLNRQEQYELERSQEEERLLESFVEGETNVVWENTGLDYLRVMLSDSVDPKLPLIPKAEWIRREMEKWDKTRPKVPSGRFQDPAAKVVKYRQRFVDAIKKLEPNALEELRQLGRIFNRLFTNESGERYLKVLDDLRINLISHRLYIDESFCNFDHSYVWGEAYNTFLLARERFVSMQPNYERRLSESIYAFIEERSYILNPFERVIKQAFNESAETSESILANFFALQGSVYSWAERYHLRKDWLIDYAYYLIYQYSRDENLKVLDLVIGQKNYSPRTLASPFHFETNGWWASEEGETAEQYSRRVTEEFEQYRENYIVSATRTLRLNELKQATRPPTYESVEWLVCSTVKEWDADRIVEQFYPEIAAARTTKNGYRAFESKKKHVENEMRKLETYDLPLRSRIEPR